MIKRESTPEHEAVLSLILDGAALTAERDRLKASNAKLVGVLQGAQELRPLLLKQLGHVPECILHYCNQARAALSRATETKG